MEYFSKIIIPNSFTEKGDNAFYIVADCLFTRRFWNRFTWTGVNRGEKSKHGFREFGNVTQLLLTIVQIGDPSYTRQQLEKFCKTRLFRHAKSRSSNKMLRKSSCRTKRGAKGKRIKHEHSSEAESADNAGPGDTDVDDLDVDNLENISTFEQSSDDEGGEEQSLSSSIDS